MKKYLLILAFMLTGCSMSVSEYFELLFSTPKNAVFETDCSQPFLVQISGASPLRCATVTNEYGGNCMVVKYMTLKTVAPKISYDKVLFGTGTAITRVAECPGKVFMPIRPAQPKRASVPQEPDEGRRSIPKDPKHPMPWEHPLDKFHYEGSLTSCYLNCDTLESYTVESCREKCDISDEERRFGPREKRRAAEKFGYMPPSECKEHCAEMPLGTEQCKKKCDIVPMFMGNLIGCVNYCADRPFQGKGWSKGQSTTGCVNMCREAYSGETKYIYTFKGEASKIGCLTYCAKEGLSGPNNEAPLGFSNKDCVGFCRDKFPKEEK